MQQLWARMGNKQFSLNFARGMSSLKTSSYRMQEGCHKIYPSQVCMYRFSTLCKTYITTFPGAGDVWFSLRNKTFQNNSIVILDDIGESNENALLCRTNLTACCKLPSIGNWFFPNGSRVPSDDSSNTAFYRTRGEMVIRLKHRGGGEEGIYSCEIPDSVNVTQTIYIGVYTSTGE